MVNHPPAIIFSSPRSQSYWLSRYLSYGGWSFDHEYALQVRSLADVRSWLSQPYVGTVETSGAAFWRLVMMLRPDAKVVVVRRQVDEVIDSLYRIGLPLDREKITRTMIRHDLKLAQIAKRVPGALSIRYADLANEDTCAAIFEHCLPFKHDHEWWQRISAVNLQINLPAMLRREAAFAPQLRSAEAVCKRKVIVHLRRNHSPASDDGVLIREETYEAA